MHGPPPSAAGPSQGHADPNQTPTNIFENSPAQCASTAQQTNMVEVPSSAAPSQSHATPHAMQFATLTVPPPYNYYYYPPNSWASQWYQSTYPSRTPRPPGPLNGERVTNQAADQTNALKYESSLSGHSAKHDKSPSHSPTPPPPIAHYHQYWDTLIRSFLSTAGLVQALRGFETDMLVVDPDTETQKIAAALHELTQGLLRLEQSNDENVDRKINPIGSREPPLKERKLRYVQLANGVEPHSQSSITKSISRFLARKRAQNDLSNRDEFLHSLAGKRRRLSDTDDCVTLDTISSCARTDAKIQNRDIQMKYDIARNEDGPLRKTLKVLGDTTVPDHGRSGHEAADGIVSAERYPALDERLRNIEVHLATRYVPSPPQSLLDRLKFLEDHITHLEKEYPPWAALHFNQPNRGWPPPPRPTPIIVPSHLTSSSYRVEESESASKAEAGSALPVHNVPAIPEESDTRSTKGKGKSTRNMSSLHRAVMERLAVQKAMRDLAGNGGL